MKALSRKSDTRRIFANEAVKLLSIPAFYICVLLCCGLNIYMLWYGVGYKLESINADIAFLKEDAGGFGGEYYYDYYGHSDFQTVCAYAKGERAYGNLTNRLIDSNYARLLKRVKTMKPEEKNSISFTGLHRLHIFFYGSYVKYLIIESMLLIMLAVFYAMHFENYHHTGDITAVCKYKNTLVRMKLLAAAVFALLLNVVLWLFSFLAYFSLIDYSGIWDSYISSVYNADRRVISDLYLYNYPYVTWKPMTQASYLLATVGVVSLLLLFAVLLAAACSLCFQNDIEAFMVIVGGVFLMYCLGTLIQPGSFLEFVFQLTPVHLISKCGYWFMDYAPGDSYPAYEWLVGVVWIVLLLLVVLRQLIGRKRNKLFTSAFFARMQNSRKSA